MISASEAASVFSNGLVGGISDTVDTLKTGFMDWLNGDDQICTDGKDDGKLSLKEIGIGILKSAGGIIKAAYNHPLPTAIATGAVIGGAAALSILAPAAAPYILYSAAGLTGAGTFLYGGHKLASAKTDAEAKQAVETIGSGAWALLGTAASANAVLNAGAKAGVASAQLTDDTVNILQANAQVLKSMPEAMKLGANQAKGNFLTWTTGTIHANSNVLRNNQYNYTSKPNDVEAYRFNGSGSADDVLTNNPGVFQGDDGNFYVSNKWSPDEPYLIDATKEQMIMMYDGTDDMAVCAGDVFNASYVDQAAFRANGTQNYLNPSDLTPGEIINATKQAKGSFSTAPVGSKIQTLEGLRTLNAGEVIAIDNAGNPYAMPAANVLKRNTGFSGNGQEILELIKNAQ